MRALAYGNSVPKPSAELKQQATRVFAEWINLNPDTKAALDFVNGLWFRNVMWNFRLNEGSFELGEFKIAHDLKGVPFRQNMEATYDKIKYQYGAGATNDVLVGVFHMVELVAGTDPNNFAFSQGGVEKSRDDFVKYTEQQLKKATELLKKVDDVLGAPPPGPAKPVPVNGTGQIDVGKTFQIALNGGTVQPGNVTFLDLPCGLSLTQAPTGSQFIGSMFDLSADSSLKIDGGSIDVSFTYGDPVLLGLPTSEAAEFQLVRFADGQYQSFLSSYNDTSNFLFKASYNPPIPGSGLDAFGEFAIVAPISQLSVGDGLINVLLNGTGTNQLTALIPQQFCDGDMCNIAQGGATGTGNLSSSGTYTLSSPSNAPFYLVANDDGSFTVTQTDQIRLNYTSPQGTLTGLIQLNWMPEADNHLRSAMVGSLTVTGGTFAHYFPDGSDVSVTLGFSGDPSMLVDHHGFVTADFQDGTLDPGCAEQVSNFSAW